MPVTKLTQEDFLRRVTAIDAAHTRQTRVTERNRGLGRLALVALALVPVAAMAVPAVREAALGAQSPLSPALREVALTALAAAAGVGLAVVTLVIGALVIRAKPVTLWGWSLRPMHVATAAVALFALPHAPELMETASTGFTALQSDAATLGASVSKAAAQSGLLAAIDFGTGT